MKPNVLKNNLSFLKSVERRLARRRIQSAAVEAESLVRYFGRVGRLDFFTGTRPLSVQAKKAVRRALCVRSSGVPLCYILKKADFYGHPFFVSKDTLIPRPETELLVEEAMKLIPSDPPLRRRRMMSMQPPIRVLDIGTGCGCIAISLTIAKPHCRMTALEFSKKALKVARKNIQFHGLEKKIKLVESNLFGSFGSKFKGFWDVIVSNPPYVDSKDLLDLPKEVQAEPLVSLDGGPLGLRVIGAILEKAPYYLKKNGWLLLEIGAGQAEILEKQFLSQGRYKKFSFVNDFAGIKRILIARNG